MPAEGIIGEFNEEEMDRTVGGFLVKKDDRHEIQAIITSWGIFRVGDPVRNRIERHIIGPIISIEQPYSDCRTSDVLKIRPIGKKLPIRMKLDEVIPA